jgi:hypothetical protein
VAIQKGMNFGIFPGEDYAEASYKDWIKAPGQKVYSAGIHKWLIKVRILTGFSIK